MKPSTTHKPALHTDAHLLDQMAEALLHGFKLSASLQCTLQRDQCSVSMEAAVQQWLRTLLACPDRDLCERLLPLVAKRFGDYLHQLERDTRWVH